MLDATAPRLEVPQTSTERSALSARSPRRPQGQEEFGLAAAAVREALAQCGEADLQIFQDELSCRQPTRARGLLDFLEAIGGRLGGQRA